MPTLKNTHIKIPLQHLGHAVTARLMFYLITFTDAFTLESFTYPIEPGFEDT